MPPRRVGNTYGNVGSRGIDLGNASAAALSATIPGLPDFDIGTSALLPVHILPLGLRDLAAARAGQHEQHDRLCGGVVLVLADRHHQTLDRVGSQETLPVQIGSFCETISRIDARTGDIPFASKVEQSARDHQNPVRCASGIAFLTHVLDQVSDMLARDLIERELTERRANLNPKVGFIRPPASLGCLGVGQVTVSDELVERRDRPQFLAAGLGASSA
jgi:hypothetical protein